MSSASGLTVSAAVFLSALTSASSAAAILVSSASAAIVVVGGRRYCRLGSPLIRLTVTAPGAAFVAFGVLLFGGGGGRLVRCLHCLLGGRHVGGQPRLVGAQAGQPAFLRATSAAATTCLVTLLAKCVAVLPYAHHKLSAVRNQKPATAAARR